VAGKYEGMVKERVERQGWRIKKIVESSQFKLYIHVEEENAI